MNPLLLAATLFDRHQTRKFVNCKTIVADACGMLGRTFARTAVRQRKRSLSHVYGVFGPKFALEAA